MALAGVTFDLWGTIIREKDPPEKIARRREIILGALAEAGYVFEVEDYRAHTRRANAIAKERIERERVDIGPEGRWQLVVHELGIAEGLVPWERISSAYEELTLEFLPPLMPGVAEAVAHLSERVRLGLICNTGFTGAAPLRQVLDAHGLTRYFDTLTFSNEFGYLKPHPRIFEHTLEQLGVSAQMALHVGDVENVDVVGARSVGMLAARYLPEGEGDTAGHLLVRDWREFPRQIEGLVNSG